MNVSSVLENILGVSELQLNGIEGVKNASLGAEGTAIRLAYNNIMRMLLGGDELTLRRIEVRDFGRQLNQIIMDQFPDQRKFCPYTKREQSQFNKIQVARSQRFISQFSGPWIDEVFTPIIRKKSIALVSEFEKPDRKIAAELLEVHINELLGNMSMGVKSIGSAEVLDAINFFMKNEKKLVL